MERAISVSLILLLVTLVGTSLMSTKTLDPIEGTWKEPQKGITIQIYQEADRYFGRLIATEDLVQNEQIREHGEILLLRDFKKESQTHYCCGTIFQPKEKRTLSATLTLEDENYLIVRARYGIFSGTSTWNRL